MMRVNKGNGLAIVLIVLGSIMLLGKFTPFFGHFVGHLIGYLIPIAMIMLGYYGVKKGNAIFGWIVLVLGGLILLGKLSWLLGPLLAIGLIIFGVSMLSDRRRRY